MGILIQEEQGLFTLQTERTTYQMKVIDHGVLRHQYYGARVEDDMEYLIKYRDSGFSGNPYEAGNDRSFSLDTIPQEITGCGVGDYRVESAAARAADGSRALDFRYRGYETAKGKYSLPGLPAMYGEEAQTLKLRMRDEPTGLEAELLYSVWEKYDVITRAVRFVNTSGETLYLEKADSFCLDLPWGEWELLHFHGRHAMERLAERVPVMHGIQSVGSTRGTSSHHHNPFVVLCSPDCAEDHGECIGAALLYSGSFEAQLEKDQMHQLRLVMGIQSTGFSWELAPGQDFWTPEAALTYSGSGFEKMSHSLHRAFRNNLCRGKYQLSRRPVLLNNWEATYFDFDEEKIFHIAEQASKLGVELLVLDDGWFGKRDSDTSGLGDWFVNEKKLKGGLKALVERVNALGMKFGIWFEPEMVSEDSDLYRAHPDWALTIPGRKPNRSRYQLVLDMSRQEVRDYLYERFCAVLDGANISYIKWDMNRSLCDLYSAKLPASRQGETAHRYVLGLYELLERLTSRYPDVLFEGCSGGGGRFDAGLLYYFPQSWCSDDTDAVERLQIQYGTSFGYPISAVGSHVSACPNHQTGRTTPIETRAVVAMAGSFGYELDLNKISDGEKELVKGQIARYQSYQPLIHGGDYYRLSGASAGEDCVLWAFVSEDKSEALVQGVQLCAHANTRRTRVRLRGLDASRRYRISGEERSVSGAALMQGGILLPEYTGDYQPVELYLRAEE